MQALTLAAADHRAVQLTGNQSDKGINWEREGDSAIIKQTRAPASELQYCERGLFFLKTAIFKWKKNKNGKFLPQIKNISLQILPTAKLSTVPLNFTILSNLVRKKQEFSTNTLQ